MLVLASWWSFEWLLLGQSVLTVSDSVVFILLVL